MEFTNLLFFLQTDLTKQQVNDILDSEIEKESIMEIGKRIEKVLEKSGISQRDLANRIGVDESIVSRIIKGERTPKSDVLANIATALHTTSDYLLGIESDEFDSKKTIRLIARNSSKLTESEKKELINALFEEE